MIKEILVLILFSLVLIVILTPKAIACTRAVYLGPEDTIITARSMDWFRDLETNLWAFPRGLERDGAAGPNSLQWTSKYGSVVASAYDAASTDGINEKGLVANLLYLTESEYVKPSPEDPRKTLSTAAWVQYVLDNYATVAEVVDDWRQDYFYVVTDVTPDGKPGQLHLSISDATGDSAIFEYIQGKLTIHHGRQFQVMTNSPPFDQQIALNDYWEQIGGTTMLPGTNRAADRFVRASFYINAIPQTAEIERAIAGSFSVIRNVSVPLGISTPEQPNISSTLWRTVSDHKNKRYFFESTLSPNVFWVNLADLDFTEQSTTKKLTLTNDVFLAGNTSGKFKPAEPFKFLEAKLD